ncbi:hypothetical protein AB0C93_06440 [Streptomyces sp. NPDC048518]|uniref:hypothetical protein n=1 Tax=Streptomyces sp. NPDC048518 TaxID=3155029 RepID=UPI00340CB500
MPDFHRPPDWDQPADRHTSLIDPVITVRQLSRFGFARKALTRIDHALVFTTARGGYEAYLPPLRPSRGEAAAKRYTSVYEVDMGVHPHQAEIALPSDNDAFEFLAAVDLSWQVVAPADFVRSGHRNVPTLLLGELQQAARDITRRFAIHDSARAERQLLHALSGQAPLGTSAGLQVLWTLRLRRDQQNIDHHRRLQSIDHDAAERIRTEQQGIAYDIELNRRTRKQDELQAGRATEYGRLDHELALRRQAWQQEQAQLRARHDAELRQLEAEKITFYQGYLEQGGVVAWSMHLAKNPQDSRLVVDSMREDQLRLILAEVELARELLSGDSAESYELEGPKRRALDFMYEIFSQHVSGISRDLSPSRPSTTPSPPESGLTETDPSPDIPRSVHANKGAEEAPDQAPAPAPAPAPAEQTGGFPGWQPPPGYGSQPGAQPPQRGSEEREGLAP